MTAAPTRSRARVSLLDEVGGRYVEVAGTDVADALLHVATAENATQIVLGASRESQRHRDVAGLGGAQAAPATHGAGSMCT